MNTLTMLGILLMFLMIMAGYFRGILRVLVALAALFVASFIAVPLSFTTRWAVDKIELIPLTFKPLGAALLAGILFFAIFQSAGEYILHTREKKLKEEGNPPIAKWERYGGVIFGILWGFILYAFILTGVDVIASVDETMNRAAAASKELALLRQKPGFQSPDAHKAGANASTAQKGGSNAPSENHSAAGATAIPQEETPDNPSTYLESQIREPLANFRAQLKSSFYAPVVKKFNPVNEKASRTLEKLMVVVKDPTFFEKFQSHPVVAQLSKNPRIQELSQDEEIKKIIQEKRYKDLLDNPKIAVLLNDRQLFKDFSNVDIEKVLDEVTIEKEGSEKAKH